VSQRRPFTCAICKGDFTTERSLEEVLAETREVFGSVPAEADRAAVCDDCYDQFMAWFNALGPEERAEMERKEHGA
jgi:hypothetical protein